MPQPRSSIENTSLAVIPIALMAALVAALLRATSLMALPFSGPPLEPPRMVPGVGLVTDRCECQERTTLILRSDGSAYLNAKPVAHETITPHLVEMLEFVKEPNVLLIADRDVAYGSVMIAVDQLQRAGVEHFRLMAPRQTSAERDGGR